MQASKLQALYVKIEMVSGANVVEEAIDLIERYQGQRLDSITRKDKVLTDNNIDSGQTAQHANAIKMSENGKIQR